MQVQTWKCLVAELIKIYINFEFDALQIKSFSKKLIIILLQKLFE